MKFRDGDRCLSCDHTRRVHSRMPGTVSSKERGWCVYRCNCQGFIALTEWDAGDREHMARKDASAKGRATT